MRFSVFGVLGILVACGGSNEATDDEEGELGSKPRIQILVTVDWEGSDLRQENIQAMHDFHAQMPNVRMVQFLNAAYFTKPGANASDVKAKIAPALIPTDERGLHIHGWKRLVEASGVTFRSKPSFWGPQYPLQDDCNVDCGHEIAISAYTEPELEKIVRFSIDTLASHGLGHAKSFRAGGWMASDSVRQAIVHEGIVWDSSAVPSTFLAGELQGLPLLDWVGTMWKGTTDMSQPLAISTGSGTLKEIPDNGALADYVTADEMFQTFLDNEAAFQKDKTTRTMVIGFHQETAAKYVYRVKDALTRIFDRAAKDKVPVTIVTTRSVKL
jgi:hypothetical protein